MAAIFNDPAVEPTNTLIAHALGPARQPWEEILDALRVAGAMPEWRYHRDGGWKIKAAKNGKTIALLQVGRGFSRVTCWFAVRHQRALAIDPELSHELRDSIIRQTPTGEVFPVTVQVRTHRDASDALSIILCKLRLK
ncbi:MAG: DUF3788 domain-containing protein [Propionibacteriaceae bacterium]|nr:DUF3788 domain-containing protein [Propionibacteriaceae bacterium]